MASVGIRELLEAGVHFGHQTRRWNPKMRRFIFGERAGIHIIDLQQTERLLAQAQEFAADIAARGGVVMFVGTKKTARDAVKEAAEGAGMPYIHKRWLGGLLTNFQTINKRIKRLHDLTDWTENGTLELLPTRERLAAVAERDKLENNLGGVRNLQRPPDAIFFVDLKTEAIGVKEAERLRIPIIGLVDTNVDPDPVSYPIPGNDDAIRSCKVIVDAIASVVGERHAQFRAEEEKARKDAEAAAAAAAAAQQQQHAGAARAGEPDPATAPAEVEPQGTPTQPADTRPGGAEVRKEAEERGEQPAKDEVEQAERDKKAPVDQAKRPRGGEEADVKAAEQDPAASRPDQEIG
ncbi:MAG: small subunit ribosomal protein [Thermoleophilaceae bacterium]|nr:small subunit ribosomal protein [Thermoleophilaceae bacterium]